MHNVNGETAGTVFGSVFRRPCPGPFTMGSPASTYRGSVRSVELAC